MMSFETFCVVGGKSVKTLLQSGRYNKAFPWSIGYMCLEEKALKNSY